MAELAGSTRSLSMPAPSGVERVNLLFFLSAFLFRIGLALVTFEQDRPFGIMLSDYCFFLSLLFFFSFPKYRLMKGAGLLTAGALILAGALLSLLNDPNLNGAVVPLAKLFTLFGLFAPLAIVHAKNIRKNMLFLIVGIFVNCAVTLLQAWVFPGMVDALSINPQTLDQSEIQRFQGLTEFPVTLGLSAALAVLIGAGLLLSERRKFARWGLAFLLVICAIAGLLSGSRTFLVALIPGLIVFALLQKNRRRTVVRALVAVAAVWVAITYFSPSAISQYAVRLDSVGFVDYARLAVAAQGVMDISQKPILGWGINHFTETGLVFIPEINDFQGAHVTLLQYWYGAGLLGAIGFLTLFIIPVRRMLRVLRERPSRFTNAVRLIFACYVSFFIIFNLGPYLYNRFLYIPMFVFAGFAARLPLPVETCVVARHGQGRGHPASRFTRSEAPINPDVL